MQNFNGTPVGGIVSNFNVVSGLLRHLVIALIFRQIQYSLFRIEGDRQINPMKDECDCGSGVMTHNIIFESVAFQTVKMSIFIWLICDIR
jgi:hypothetical protein